MKLCCLGLMMMLVVFSACLGKKKYPLEDRQLWLEAEFKYEAAKGLSLEMSEELRYYKNRGVLAQSLTDIGASYTLTSFFKAGMFYRYRLLPDESDKRHETYLNLSFKTDLGRLDISNRVRLHLKFPFDKDIIYNFRNKITVGYKAARWIKPYLSAEIFYRFLYAEGDRLSQGRYYAGAELNLSDSHGIDLFIMREQEYNNDKAVNSNIIGLGYSFSF